MKFRKTLSAALAACILTGSCITPAFAEEPAPVQLVFGDINMDQSVDVADAVAVARYCVMDYDLKLTDQGKLQGDVNADGNLDEADVLKIIRFIARQIERDALGKPDQQPAEYKYQATCLTDAVTSGTVSKKKADETFIASQMKLTADLFKGAAQDPQTTDNMLISPLSVSQALAMTTNGAEDNTRTEMEKLLGDTLDIEALNQYYADYTAMLTASDELSIANSLWVRNAENRIKVPKEFLQTAKDYYHADAFTAPFDDSTVKDVNNWVDTNTKHMIPTLIDEIDENWIMLLINALAFEAEWTSPYMANDVHDGVFHAYDGDMTATMMYGEESTYLEDEYATGFLKQYKGGKYSFAAVLPKQEKSVTVSDYIGMMTGESLQNLLNSSKQTEVHTMLPKFKYDYTITLNDVLYALGMKDAFIYPLARFGKLNSVNPECKVDLVLHKTFIQVDELGTKAGAVTMVAIADNAVGPTDYKTVCLDRPFIYMIIDNETQLPVFIGTVMHPTEAENPAS